MKAATAARMPKVRNDEISIHAAREGGDHSSHLVCLLRIRISIHAAREGGDLDGCVKLASFNISIHAAREGGDGVQELLKQKGYNFNPRRP